MKCKRWLVACSRELFTEKNITRNTYSSLESGSTVDAILNKLNESLTNEECNATPHVYEHSRGKLISDQGYQTLYSKYELSAKVKRKPQAPTIVSTLSYENIVQDASLMKHFIGLSPPQFEILHNFLDDVCPLETINYWTSKDCPATENARTGPRSDFSSREKLFIFLLRLRRGFTLKTLAALFSTPERKIDPSYVRKILTTFLQVIYLTFRDMQHFMFPCNSNASSCFMPCQLSEHPL